MERTTVYFATNRQPITGTDGTTITDFGADLGPVSGLAVRFGSVEVEVTDKEEIIIPGSLFVAPETLFGGSTFKPLVGSRTIFDKLRKSMQDQDLPTLAFIHGFSNSFADSIQRAARIQTFYRKSPSNPFDANIFVFSWPSKGSNGPIPLPFADYAHDRGTAAASGPAVARTLHILHDYVDSVPPEDRCNQKIHLLCHSMGNFVLRHGLQALIKMPDPILQGNEATTSIKPLTSVDRATPDPMTIRRTFDQIILAAADEDEDAFEDPNKLKHLPRLGRAITVYHTQNDWVLNTLSALTKFNGSRLGNMGPDNMSSISDKVTAVDATDVLDMAKDYQSHQYYRVFPAVRDDITAVLAGLRPEQIPNRVPGMPGRWRIVPAAGPRAAAPKKKK